MDFKEITYQEAQKNESSRQEFLNQFLKKNPHKAVSQLVYDAENKKSLKYL